MAPRVRENTRTMILTGIQTVPGLLRYEHSRFHLAILMRGPLSPHRLGGRSSVAWQTLIRARVASHRPQSQTQSIVPLNAHIRQPPPDASQTPPRAATIASRGAADRMRQCESVRPCPDARQRFPFPSALFALARGGARMHRETRASTAHLQPRALATCGGYRPPPISISVNLGRRGKKCNPHPISSDAASRCNTLSAARPALALPTSFSTSRGGWPHQTSGIWLPERLAVAVEPPDPSRCIA